LLPQGQSNQQRVAEPSAKVDLPGQAVAFATAVIRRNSPRGQETAQRQQSDGAKLPLVEHARPASAVEPAQNPAIVPVASADAASDPAAFNPLTEAKTTARMKPLLVRTSLQRPWTAGPWAAPWRAR
jgi:hypothetical protein